MKSEDLECCTICCVSPQNKYNFNVIHLSTSHSGGAGISARRLNSELNRVGVNSLFVSLSQKTYDPLDFEIGINRNFVTRIKSFLANFLNKRFFHISFVSVFSIRSLNLKAIDLFRKETSIVHIHNWYNFVDYEVLRKLLSEGCNVIITLHDERTFSGACHYALDCDGFVRGCNECPLVPSMLQKKVSKNSAVLKELARSFPKQITFIAPSKWIENRARSSSVLSDAKIHQISNVIPNHVGFPETRSTRISPEKKVIGIASVDPYLLIKGGEILLALEKSLLASHCIFLYLRDFGDSYFNFWSYIDFLFVPSLIDNSPNVITEAKQHGVRVIANNVGGIPEMLSPDLDLILDLEKLTVTEIVATIIDYAIDDASDSEISERMYSVGHESERALNSHINLYQSFRTSDKE